ncbi:monosaccharide ABC transporter substrate-binding protein, CUT2 family (TC 3.A.1.2.-) [Aureimonas altamirensis DSM 21988]|jgi:simple sugar transport system substrate-binding protein|uniref:Sugar ABC transporter substrate-binding protein n=2 Tax=Aureimonas altamirensis TaxID=370622 RepID=A0A0P0YXC3_9HYPH|nr:sugar ABC transporter substrate-binding protein [Aureimonas altamirensis]BAT26133.1 sugar ABC transporter substrate-binding protein [Aureimonas altamirensis]SHJ38627.1 monosaccharide ABC transporter substrate-binding protein, CUT2 family (TC 3.A.1.2.-) [Aureimonas altamirensis DSM 21988]
MTRIKGMNRRDILAMGAALGVGMLAAPGAFAQGRKFIPFSNKSLDYYFFVIEEEAVKRAVQAQSFEFQATNANFDNTRQLEQWQSLMLSQPSALVADPIDSQAIVSAIRRYNQRKIPVAIIDTPSDGGDVAITVSFDNFEGGIMAANEIIERLKQKYGSPRGTVLNCYGALASVAWRQRKEGMESVFAQYPDINYLARPTEGQLDQMLAVTLSTLSEFPQLDAVHAPSDSPSRGIVTALQQRDRWKKVGEEGHVIFVNIDGEPVALKWIQEGYMDSCVSQDPIAYGEIAVEMLLKHSLNGEAVPIGTYENKKYFWEKGEIVDGKTGPTLIIPPFVINGDNATDPRHWGTVAEKDWGIAYT